MEFKKDAIDYVFEDSIILQGLGEDGDQEKTFNLRFELRYDESVMVLNSWICEPDKEFDERPNSQLLLFGTNQINLISIVMATMLEAYGQPTMKSDKNLQKLYRKMAKEAKDAIPEKTA